MAVSPIESIKGSFEFSLYNNHTYEVCTTGDVETHCYSGTYSLKGDTLVLEDLSKDVPLYTNRLLIVRYSQQDSMYWKWKYPNRVQAWQDLKEEDLIVNGLGDVYELDDQNEPVRELSNVRFTIREDRLTAAL